MSDSCVIDGVHFQPHVGEKYYSVGYEGIRVLILGESHYGTADKAKPDYTKKMVEDLAISRSYRYFSTLLRLVKGYTNGRKVHTSERREFWSSVAFYNYIQEFPGDKALIRPKDYMWKNAEAPFLSVLERLKPQLMLVTGNTLGTKLPMYSMQLVKCSIMHPSAPAFRYSEWNIVVANAVASCSTT